MILHTSISVIASTHLSTEQIDFLVSDREYTHSPDALIVLLEPPRCITEKRGDVSASARSTQRSSAVTNRGWIKLLSGRLALI